MKLAIKIFGSKPALVIFLMTFIAYSYFFHRFRFWNVNSRLALTYAIVDKGTFKIDDYRRHPWYETEDCAVYAGHYYSDKIIGLSLLAVPGYWIMKHAGALVEKDFRPDLSRYGLTVMCVSLPAALLAVVLLHFLVLLQMPPPIASAVVLFFSFGTMLFPFASLFYPYLPSLLFLVTALYLIMKFIGDMNTKMCLLAGGLVGCALLCDYTLAFPAMLISMYFARTIKNWHKITAYAFAVSIPLGLFAAYNWLCFGNPFSLPYSHLESEEFQKGMSQGLMGVHHFQWYVLYLITLSPYRGIFFYSPFLLLGFIGLWRGFHRASGRSRSLACLIALIIFYYFWLNASYYMWWGGGTLLSRHLIPILPFKALAFAWLPRRLTPILLISGVVSILLIGSQSVVEPHYEPMESNESLYQPWATVERTGKAFTPPYLRHSLPELMHGRISMNPFNCNIFAADNQTWTLIPLIVIEAGLFVWLRRILRSSAAITA